MISGEKNKPKKQNTPLKQMESSAQEHLEQQMTRKSDEEKQKITVAKSTFQPQLAALRSLPPVCEGEAAVYSHV